MLAVLENILTFSRNIYIAVICCIQALHLQSKPLLILIAYNISPITSERERENVENALQKS